MQSGAAVTSGRKGSVTPPGVLDLESTRTYRWSSIPFAEGSAAPQISQVFSEGWFTNVQRGHETVRRKDFGDMLLSGSVASMKPATAMSPSDVPGACRGSTDTTVEGPSGDVCAMAALRMWVKGGVTPQDKHGGTGVCAITTATSKLDGIGLEKEQMRQIQVRSVAAGGGLWIDRVLPGDGEAEGLRADAVTVADDERRSPIDLGGLAYRLILGDDFRKPAYLGPVNGRSLGVGGITYL